MYNGFLNEEIFQFNYNASNYKTTWAILYDFETQECSCFADACPIDNITTPTVGFTWEPSLEATGLEDVNGLCEFTVTCEVFDVPFVTTDFFPCGEGIEEEENKSNSRSDTGQNKDVIKIYPSPAYDQIVIKIINRTVFENCDVNIYSSNGEKIKNLGRLKNSEGIIIDISTLDSGMYFINLNSSNYNLVEKFIKI
jgi:hypothetical protein